MYKKMPFGIGGFLEQLFQKIPFLSWAVTLFFIWWGWLLFFYPVSTACNMARLLFCRS